MFDITLEPVSETEGIVVDNAETDVDIPCIGNGTIASIAVLGMSGIASILKKKSH